MIHYKPIKGLSNESKAGSSVGRILHYSPFTWFQVCIIPNVTSPIILRHQFTPLAPEKPAGAAVVNLAGRVMGTTHIICSCINQPHRATALTRTYSQDMGCRV
ncbi:uncharacterized protein TrAtP1_005482 [Trichoderma atroviride]|uniref:uncharacterized protein n=1 Tax=Hypocrea atroviridis TaxID=63577 RepID=UPI0033349F0D|nr:hypothetical protein TrAtP1_005482 [Trichoderma atroviride]